MLVQGTINTGGTFTGTYNGLGKMVLTLAESTLQIALRVILTWFFFPHFGLAAPAIATGIGWLMANLFWLICLTRLRGQPLLFPPKLFGNLFYKLKLCPLFFFCQLITDLAGCKSALRA